MLRLPLSLIIVSVIALALSSSLFVDSYAFSGVVESTITVKSREADCSPLMQITDLSVQINDEVKSNAPLGSQVSVQVALTGDCKTDYPVTILLEVRDVEEATTYLAYQDTEMEKGRAAASFSWLADDAGNYTIRIFSFTCTTCSGQGPVEARDFSVY